MEAAVLLNISHMQRNQQNNTVTFFLHFFPSHPGAKLYQLYKLIDSIDCAMVLSLSLSLILNTDADTDLISQPKGKPEPSGNHQREARRDPPIL